MADVNTGSGDEGSSSSEATPLSDIFNNTPETSANASSSEDEHEDEDKGSQKFPEGSSSSEDDESESEKPEKKADEKKADAKDADKTADASDKKEDSTSQEDKAQKDKWDAEENPYKKRFQDTAANWNREHQENLQMRQAVSQMQQEMVTLRKMADGTYDPEKDAPPEVTHEQVASKALNVGKVLASKNAAISQFGKERVDGTITEFNQLFEGNKAVNDLVVNAESPIHEVFRIMDRYKFESKYGSTPTDMHKNIRAEVEKELRETIRKEVTEEIMGRVDKKKQHPSFSSSRGSNGLGKGANSKSGGATPLSKIFPK
jgi:hypothetical protein